MSTAKLTAAEEYALLRQAQRRLRHLQCTLPGDIAEADRLLGLLPARQDQETVGDRLRRMTRLQAVMPLTFRPLIAIERWAAESGEAQYPLPEPGKALESSDGRFRLRITAEGGRLRIDIQALGFAVDEFANRRIGLVRWRPAFDRADQPHRLPNDEVVAVIDLDDEGDGTTWLEDRPEIRYALLFPGIGLIDER
jgi:hypothetical protein